MSTFLQCQASFVHRIALLIRSHVAPAPLPSAPDVARMSAASSWKILEKHGKVKPVSRGPHAILAVALAILAGLYEVNSQHLTRATRGVAGRVFGPRLVSGDEDSQEEQEEH